MKKQMPFLGLEGGIFGPWKRHLGGLETRPVLMWATIVQGEPQPMVAIAINCNGKVTKKNRGVQVFCKFIFKLF
jgi:hypothetical protein